MAESTRQTIARIVAILGTVLVGLPLVTPLVLALISLIITGVPHFDLLMPGELFVVVAIGGLLVLAAALLSRRRRASILIPFAVALVAFALQALFTVTAGWSLALVIAAYALYVAAVVALFVTGALLCRSLFARTEET